MSTTILWLKAFAGPRAFVGLGSLLLFNLSQTAHFKARAPIKAAVEHYLGVPSWCGVASKRFASRRAQCPGRCLETEYLLLQVARFP